MKKELHFPVNPLWAEGENWAMKFLGPQTLLEQSKRRLGPSSTLGMELLLQVQGALKGEDPS